MFLEGNKTILLCWRSFQILLFVIPQEWLSVWFWSAISNDYALSCVNKQASVYTKELNWMQYSMFFLLLWACCSCFFVAHDSMFCRGFMLTVTHVNLGFVHAKVVSCVNNNVANPKSVNNTIRISLLT